MFYLMNTMNTIYDYEYNVNMLKNLCGWCCILGICGLFEIGYKQMNEYVDQMLMYDSYVRKMFRNKELRLKNQLMKNL